MGKANRPLVVRKSPGESAEQAFERALKGPNAHKRDPKKIILRVMAK